MAIALRGLPGVKAAQLMAYQVSSVSQAMEELLYNRAVTAAGDCGAINVWKDDGGAYRSELCRRLSTVATITCTTKSTLRAWLKEHWPMLHKEVRG